MKRKRREYCVYVKYRPHNNMPTYYTGIKSTPTGYTYTQSSDSYAYHSRYSSYNKAIAKCVELLLGGGDDIEALQVRRLGVVMFRL